MGEVRAEVRAEAADLEGNDTGSAAK